MYRNLYDHDYFAVKKTPAEAQKIVPSAAGAEQ
jgi:hypothetical protein